MNPLADIEEQSLGVEESTLERERADLIPTGLLCDPVERRRRGRRSSHWTLQYLDALEVVKIAKIFDVIAHAIHKKIPG